MAGSGRVQGGGMLLKNHTRVHLRALGYPLTHARGSPRNHDGLTISRNDSSQGVPKTYPDWLRRGRKSRLSFREDVAKSWR